VAIGRIKHLLVLCVKGTLFLIAAYVETGKTTFAAQTVSHMARQLPDESHPILWINNEEQSAKVMFRVIQSYFGVTTEELVKNAKHYEEIYNKKWVTVSSSLVMIPVIILWDVWIAFVVNIALHW
jgi:KaiC/GvpD/RAD55 family RecA-like ATPase